MYTPSHFAESRLPVLHELIRRRPFATLVANTSHGLDAVHLPLLPDESSGALGTLQGHLARPNPIWQEWKNDAELLAIFHGPHHYVSPAWYPSKFEHGKTVPTWNYVVVHAQGTVTVIDDVHWLRKHLERMTHMLEQNRPEPWRLSDLPADYMERLIAGVVGFEIHVTGFDGKWKVSQNRNACDQAGVIDGLLAESSQAADEMAQLIRERNQQ